MFFFFRTYHKDSYMARRRDTMGHEGRYRRTSSPNTSRFADPNGHHDVTAPATAGVERQKVTAKEKFHQSLLIGSSGTLPAVQSQQPNLLSEPPTAAVQPITTDSNNPGRPKVNCWQANTQSTNSTNSQPAHCPSLSLLPGLVYF